MHESGWTVFTVSGAIDLDGDGKLELWVTTEKYELGTQSGIEHMLDRLTDGGVETMTPGACFRF